MDILFSNLPSEYILDFGKWSLIIHKYMYLCIFSLTTYRSPKLIPKADLKRECPYLHSIFLKRFGQYFKKSKNGFFIVFSKSELTSVGYIFFTKTNYEKAKHHKICLSLGGSMPEAQIKPCPLTPSPIINIRFLDAPVISRNSEL